MPTTDTRNAKLLEQCIGKTVKSVADTFDASLWGDDDDGFIIEFTDGSKLVICAISDKGCGIVGVTLTQPA